MIGTRLSPSQALTGRRAGATAALLGGVLSTALLVAPVALAAPAYAAQPTVCGSADWVSAKNDLCPNGAAHSLYVRWNTRQTQYMFGKYAGLWQTSNVLFPCGTTLQFGQVKTL